jgi:ABC-type lipoprotein release transport system permease subunit
MGSFFPGYAVQPSTVALGLSITFGLALLAGGVPAWRANRLRPVEALRRGK